MLNSKLKILVVGLSMAILSGISIQAAVSNHLFSSAENSHKTSGTLVAQNSSLSVPISNSSPKLITVDSKTSYALPSSDSNPTTVTTPNTAPKPVKVNTQNTAPKPNTSVTPKNKGVIAFTVSDVDLLARLIEAEAQGVSYNAKVAVGGVVVNRVQSSSFPNNIHDVIYQKIDGYYQFTPVLNGWINKPASQESINAAYAALHGSDPSKGALFYFDESITNTWLWSKKIAVRIDSLVFAF